MKKQKTRKQYYRNAEVKHDMGRNITRRVYITGGKGHISIVEKHNKRNYKVKQTLTKDEIKKICGRVFIPGLWKKCEAKLEKTIKR